MTKTATIRRVLCRARHRFGVSFVCATLSFSVPQAGYSDQTTYRFQEDDGTVWFTDHKPRGANFNKYRFIGYHGRPTATASCKGVTAKILASRAAAYSSTIKLYAEEYGVSVELVNAIITIESCFDRLALSRAGAKGLMQLMPQTAESLGVADEFDPKENIRGGIKLYAQLQKRYNHNAKLALAAYNAGPGAVDKYQGIPPYRETQGYVKKVLKKYKEYLAQASN